MLKLSCEKKEQTPYTTPQFGIKSELKIVLLCKAACEMFFKKIHGALTGQYKTTFCWYYKCMAVEEQSETGQPAVLSPTETEYKISKVS